MGATVHLVCRRTDAAEEARLEILDTAKRNPRRASSSEAKNDSSPNEQAQDEQKSSTSSSGADVHVHTLDLSEPRSVLKFAADFTEKYGKLDCLVNNAGCMVNERTVRRSALVTPCVRLLICTLMHILSTNWSVQ